MGVDALKRRWEQTAVVESSSSSESTSSLEMSSKIEGDDIQHFLKRYSVSEEREEDLSEGDEELTDTMGASANQVLNPLREQVGNMGVDVAVLDETLQSLISQTEDANEKISGVTEFVSELIEKLDDIDNKANKLSEKWTENSAVVTQSMLQVQDNTEHIADRFEKFSAVMEQQENKLVLMNDLLENLQQEMRKYQHTSFECLRAKSPDTDCSIDIIERVYSSLTSPPPSPPSPSTNEMRASPSPLTNEMRASPSPLTNEMKASPSPLTNEMRASPNLNKMQSMTSLHEMEDEEGIVESWIDSVNQNLLVDAPENVDFRSKMAAFKVLAQQRKTSDIVTKSGLSKSEQQLLSGGESKEYNSESKDYNSESCTNASNSSESCVSTVQPTNKHYLKYPMYLAVLYTAYLLGGATQGHSVREVAEGALEWVNDIWGQTISPYLVAL